MIKTLIGIRLRSMFAAVTAKKRDKGGARVPKGKIIGLSLLYLYVVAIFAFLFTMMAVIFASAMIPAGLDEVYFAFFILISFSVVFIFSIFETKSELFECKDNELLLAMPIHPKDIVVSRIFTVLIYNYIEEALVMLPCIIVYAIFGGSLLGVVGAVLVMLATPLLATALAAGVGYLVAIISKRVKKNSFITLGISLVFLAVYFVFYNFFIESMDALEDPNTDLTALADSMGAMRYLGAAATLHPLWTPLFLLLSAGVAYVAYRVISASYIKIVTDNKSSARTKYKARRLEKKSAFFALTMKELRRFFSSAAYMLNGGMGLVFAVVLGVFAVIESGELSAVVALLGDELGVADARGMLSALAISAISLISSMTYISAAALSLEGKNLWILKTMPVSAREVLFAKAMPHVIVSTPPTLVTSMLLMIAVKPSPAYWAFFILTPIAANAVGALFGMVLNTAFPKFEFENEAQPIKQSASTFFAMFGLMLIAFIISSITLVLSLFGSPILASAVALVINLILVLLFAIILAGPCARRYDGFCA